MKLDYLAQIIYNSMKFENACHFPNVLGFDPQPTCSPPPSRATAHPQPRLTPVQATLGQSADLTHHDSADLTHPLHPHYAPAKLLPAPAGYLLHRITRSCHVSPAIGWSDITEFAILIMYEYVCMSSIPKNRQTLTRTRQSFHFQIIFLTDFKV